MLEALQLDVLEKFKKDAQKVGFNPLDSRNEEALDD